MSKTLPRYQYHKEVAALQVAQVEVFQQPLFKSLVCKGTIAQGTACGQCERCDWERTNPPEVGSALLTPVEEGYGPFRVSKDWIEKHPAGKGLVGGFWILYDDGHQTWSPHNTFLQGFSLVPEALPDAEPAPESVSIADLPRFIKIYPCGCKAGPGPENMPDYCPEHGEAPKTHSAAD